MNCTTRDRRSAMTDRSRSYFRQLTVCALALVGVVGYQPLRAAQDRPSVQVPPAPDPERIPERWIDLPEAPVATLKGGKAALVNRSSKPLNTLEVGCVVEQEGVVHVVSAVFEVGVFDGVWGPAREVEGVFRTVNNVDSPVTTPESHPGSLKRCAPNAKFAVTAAGFRPEQAIPGRGAAYEWKAEGTPWPK
jgi:hypothetical protein